MRRILVSSLMLSSLIFPAAAMASQPVDVATASTAPTQVSTGVVMPTLLESTQLTIAEDFSQSFIPANSQVGLVLTVDEAGHAQNIRVVKPLTPYLDAAVVDAVRQFHFHPGSLDSKPLPVTIALTVNIAR
jgi:hypothetical protein